MRKEDTWHWPLNSGLYMCSHTWKHTYIQHQTHTHCIVSLKYVIYVSPFVGSYVASFPVPGKLLPLQTTHLWCRSVIDSFSYQKASEVVSASPFFGHFKNRVASLETPCFLDFQYFLSHHRHYHIQKRFVCIQHCAWAVPREVSR